MSIILSSKRLIRFFETLQQLANQDPQLADVGVFALVFGSSEDLTENQRTVSIIQHLFASPIPVDNVALLFGKSGSLSVFTSRDDLSVGEAASTVRLVVNPTAEDWQQSLVSHAGGSLVGVAKKELRIQKGTFAEMCITALDTAVPDEKQREVAPFLGGTLFVKDDAAVAHIAEAGRLCVATLNNFVRPELEQYLSTGSYPQVDAFEHWILQKLTYPNTIKDMEHLHFQYFAPALAQRVMHLGRYTSVIQASERCTELLRPDVICIRFGARHRGEAAAIARTFIVSKFAPKIASTAYAFLLAVHNRVFEELRPGVKLSDVYRNVVAFAQTQNAALTPHLMKNFGFITGLLVLEAKGTINEKSTIVVQPNQAFVIRSVLENVPDPNGGLPVSMEICDTVSITADGTVDIKTKFGRQLNEILFAEAVGEDEVEETQFQRDLRAITRAGKSTVPVVSREDDRETKRRQLLAKLHSEFLSSGGKNGAAESLDEVRIFTVGRLVTGDLIPYAANAPQPDVGASMLKVHREKKVAWMPICGAPTGFHISTINRVDLKREGNNSVLTVTFHSTQESNVAYKLNRTKVFVKDVAFTAANEEVFHDFYRGINDCIRDIKAADVESKNNQGLAKTGVIRTISNFKKLPNIKIRPSLIAGNKGCSGNLEIHENGLRFSSIHAIPVDILYSNVKHFIFQPSQNSIVVIFHVTLNQPMIVGKKKTDEISFYAEVMEASESVEGTKRSHDAEMEAQEKEQQRIDATNREFAFFCKALSEIAKRTVELPLSAFQVTGVTGKEMTRIRASTRVMWALESLPPFTMSVNEIELVSLERVTDSGKNFDINFIPKNYKAPIPVTTVPSEHLEAVKDWALQSGLYYTTSSINIQWTALLKTVRTDPEWEPFGPTGWVAMTEDYEDEDEETDSEDSDPDYDSDDEEDEEESDSDFSSFYSDSSLSTASDDSGSDSDASWDELERKAQKHDREKNLSDDSDDDDSDRPKRKKRVEPARPAAGRGAGQPTNSIPPRGAAAPKGPPGKAVVTKMVAPQQVGKFAVPRPAGAAPPPQPSRRF